MSSLEVGVGRAGRVEVLAGYVEFVAGRCRPNTVLATVSDLRAFFAVIDKEPAATCRWSGERPPAMRCSWC
jgi:hypothetical protein